MKKILNFAEINPMKLITKRNIIIVTVIIILMIAAALSVVALGANKGKDNAEQVADKYFNSYVKHDWGAVYDCMDIPGDEQYLTRDIFIEQMKSQNPENPEEKNNDEATDVTLEHQTNDDKTESSYTAKYTQNSAEKSLQFKLIVTDEGKIKVASDDFIVKNYKINVPNNTDVTLNNERVDEKYRVAMLATQQKYEVCLFKGSYPIILKMTYGQTVNDTAFVGINKPDGSQSDLYEIEYFKPYDTDSKAIESRCEEFVRSVYSGTTKPDNFSFSESYYNADLLDSIISERKMLASASDNNSYVGEITTENIKINSKGIAFCDVSFEENSKAAASSAMKTTTINWKLQVKKVEKEWVIEVVEF